MGQEDFENEKIIWVSFYAVNLKSSFTCKILSGGTNTIWYIFFIKHIILFHPFLDASVASSTFPKLRLRPERGKQNMNVTVVCLLFCYCV